MEAACRLGGRRRVGRGEADGGGALAGTKPAGAAHRPGAEKERRGEKVKNKNKK